MLVGPGVNQPDPHPGYAGFVGWQYPVLLRDGTLIVSFTTGYWHASPPTPMRLEEKMLAELTKIGMPTDVDAPTGGRAMLIRSTDGGRTWGRPETIIDTPLDDRSPAILELPDGTLLCSFFMWSGADVQRDAQACQVAVVRSFDRGRTWEQRPTMVPSPFAGAASDGPPVRLSDGSVVLPIYGPPKGGAHDQVAVVRTTDAGLTWKTLSVIRADHAMDETGLAELTDGRLVMIIRPEGEITWSEDGGRSWTDPVPFGMRMFEPGLNLLRDGMLLCTHGSYGAGGFRAILSRDGGQTWFAPAPNHGFAIDPSVYGYGRVAELPDGSLFAVYQHTGGHALKDAQTQAILGMRFRVQGERIELIADEHDRS
ncbi:MAG: glycoside hydrolase [Planctomycetes bacterium]|nr:glycoside hydrolase [Planctomycetota bacterium]